VLWGGFINSKKSLIQNSQKQKHGKNCYISSSLHFLYCLNIYYAKLSARSILLKRCSKSHDNMLGISHVMLDI